MTTINKDQWIAGVLDSIPEELLQGRINIECNVVGLLWNDPAIIDETNLAKEDFLSVDGRFYFGLARELRRNKHLNALDEVAVLSNIRPEVLETFEEKGGFDAIEHIAGLISMQNKELYLDALRKSNILIRLHKSGFNLMTPIVTDQGKTIVPLEIFQKPDFDSNSVLEWYETQISKMGTGYDAKILEDNDMEITDEFLDRLASGEEQGTSYSTAGIDAEGNDMRVFPFLSSQTLGFSHGASHYIGGFSSSGKTAMMCSIAMALIHQNEKILIICNEQSSKVWKINMLLFILYKKYRYLGITKSNLLGGKVSPEDRAALDMAKDYFNENCKGKLHFIHLSENNMSVVKSKIRYYALQFGYSCVIYDTFKVEDIGARGKENAAWEYLVQYSRDLDTAAKKYNLIMLCSIQIAQSYKGTLFLDSNMLSGAKQIVEQLDTLLMLRDVYKEELDPNSKLYCAPYQKVKDEDGKWEERPFMCDPTASWKMLFLAKSRNSQNSTDSGSCLMYRFLGHYAIFKEQCWGRPKHGTIQ